MDHDLLYDDLRPRQKRLERGGCGATRLNRGTRKRDADGRARHRPAAEPRGPREKAIARGLNGDACGSALAREIAAGCDGLGRAARGDFARLLHLIDARDPSLLDAAMAIYGLSRLALFARRWLRRPEDWSAQPPVPEVPAGGEWRAKLASLSRHLLCRYPVPATFDVAWTERRPSYAAAREWFVRVGTGGNLRHAAKLPYPLTARMAHFVLLARENLALPRALRYGQFAGLGVAPPLAQAAAESALGLGCDDEAFALAFGHFLARCPQLHPYQVGPIVDYLLARRFGGGGLAAQPAFDFGGRTAESLSRDARLWHVEVAHWRRMPNLALAWDRCAIDGFDAIRAADLGVVGEPADARWSIVELTAAAELADEGRALHHCVATYATAASARRCAIFSLRRDAGGGGPEPRVTVEVNLRDRQIVQARGSCNRAPDAAERAVLIRWAKAQGLTALEGVGL